MKLSDIILLSDVDGTLLPPNKEIPARNVEALLRFTQKGGSFGIATGRSRQWVQEVTEQLPVNAPCILYNGGMLYDFARDECLMEMLLPESAKSCMQVVTQKMPEVSALVVTQDECFNVHDEQSIAEFVKTRETAYRPRMDWREITTPWYKVLFLIRDGAFDDFFALVGELGYDDLRFVATNPTLIEMLPAGSSKGRAIEELLVRKGLRREQVAAVGDFYNDREMICTAGIGITLCDSPEDLRELADWVAGPCETGAVADVVEYLEARFG